ncbi:MAG: hypothetical protein EP330_13415 [Deltaproteobacteria bacterium]|nr:MAG: hypothetical protein EP330_13415 [Deltaproteobacteria bacterium]
MSVAASPEVLSSAAESRETPVPTLVDLAVSIGQFALLGAACGVGAGEIGMAARTVPSGLVVGTGALVMTAPALVVMHQYLGLAADPDQLVHTLSRGFVRAGRLAVGFAPLGLFFSTTTNLWALFLALALGGIGITILGRLVWELRLVEVEHPAPSPTSRGLTMSLLTAGWAGLATLIALRLAWDVAGFVAG